MANEKVLLKVIVGSQAHGLAGPDSDTDYRSVYALPTKDILSLGFKYKGSTWIEGETEDNTAWEIGHFLSLAFQCNPTILEVFLSPMEESNEFGLELRNLFPYVWTPKKAYDAFTVYGKNQQKKFLDKKDNRPHKYAAAHIRTLINLIELLRSGTFTVRVGDDPSTGDLLRRIKRGDYKMGEIIDITESLTNTATDFLEHCAYIPLKEEDRYYFINRFLLKVREAYWEK